MFLLKRVTVRPTLIFGLKGQRRRSQGAKPQRKWHAFRVCLNTTCSVA